MAVVNVGVHRIFFGIAVAGPALAVGGVHPPVITAFLVVVALAWARLCWPARGHLVVPVFVAVGLAATMWTLAQWLPWPHVRSWAAPGLDAEIDAALVGLAIAPREGVTPVPADTGLEVARLFGLSLLFVVATQLRWRTCAAIVALTGTAVALVGLAHETFGVERLYGVYAAQDVDLAGAAALRGPFVNANHQSGVLLLGIFAAGALAADHAQRGPGLGDPRHVDRFVAALAALSIQIPALVLSLSRAALLVFVVLTPVAMVLAWSRAPAPSPGLPRVLGSKFLVVGAIAALFVVAAGRGAWQELATLASFDTSELTGKFAAVGDALALVDLSPVFGIGRGAFVDLYPAVQELPTHRLTTHLECAPATMIVEWGPMFATLVGAATLALVGTAWQGGDTDERPARRIALLGLVAVGLQNLADFSLEFLGVAAPAVAMAGGLAVGPTWRWPRRRVGVVIGAAVACAGALSIASAPHVLMARTAADAAVVRGERSADEAIAMRPLDGRLHGLLARRHADAGQWWAVAVRSEIATRLRPGNIDAWLLRGAAAHIEGDAVGADAAIRHALALVHDVPDRELLAWLLARYPRMEDLAAVAPAEHGPWRLLVDAMAGVSPAHADAIAAARAASHPTDPEPLQVRHAMAMRLDNPALALHHARLLRQIAPNEAASHVAVSHALRSFAPPRLADARTALERALAGPLALPPSARGSIEEELVVVLLELGDPDASAPAIVEALLARPASRSERVFREGLAAQVRAVERGRR